MLSRFDFVVCVEFSYVMAERMDLPSSIMPPKCMFPAYIIRFTLRYTLDYTLHVLFVYAIGSDTNCRISPKSSSTTLLSKLELNNNYYFEKPFGLPIF